MNVQSAIEKSLKKKWCLRLRTRHPDREEYDGVVVHFADEFVAVKEETNFQFDGITILPLIMIKSVRDGDYEKCANQILRMNRSIAQCRAPRWLKACSTLADVIKELEDRGDWPGIEIFPPGGKKTEFYIGPITKISKKGFFLFCYDAAGNWELEYKLKYERIYRIEFDSAYCNHFNAYMRAKNGAA